MKLIIHTDGGARGNPGPAAIGVVIESILVEPNSHGESKLQWKKEYGESIGRATNNVAEYSAIVFALKKAKQLLGKEHKSVEIDLRTDSELIYKQMRGEYKIKDENMQSLFIEVWNLKQDFKSVIFTHVRREKNKEADKMVNKALDTLL